MSGRRVAGWRHQLPAYSPLSGHALLAGAGAALGRVDSRARLVALLREEYAADAATLCGSGTDALQRALLHAARPGRRTVVALPAYSCYDVATAAVGAGVDIALYDIDPVTLGPDFESLERTLAAGVSVAVVAPLYGMPVAWDIAERIAADAGVLLIEDAAQGHGARWDDRPLGSFGRLSTLSFGRGKGWTGGGGGALLARNTAGEAANGRPPIGADARALAGAAGQWLFGRAGAFGFLAALPWLELGQTVYHDPAPPVELATSAAAIVLATRQLAERGARYRHTMAAYYRDRLQDARGVQPIAPLRRAVPGYLRFPVRVPGGIDALGDRGELSRLGIMPGYPQPLGALAAVRARLTGPETYWPGAEELVRQLVTLPTHSQIADRVRERILAVFAGSRDLRVAYGGAAAGRPAAAPPLSVMHRQAGT